MDTLTVLKKEKLVLFLEQRWSPTESAAHIIIRKGVAPSRAPMMCSETRWAVLSRNAAMPPAVQMDTLTVLKKEKLVFFLEQQWSPTESTAHIIIRKRVTPFRAPTLCSVIR